MRVRINKSYLELAVGDITDFEVDAIVNAANSSLKKVILCLYDSLTFDNFRNSFQSLGSISAAFPLIEMVT